MPAESRQKQLSFNRTEQSETFQSTGRTLFYLKNWGQLTTDPSVLDIVKGYRLRFKCHPHQFYRPITNPKSSKEFQAIKQEVNSLLSKGAIKQIAKSQAKFVSRLFTVPKKSGGLRPVINLKPLNQFLHLQTFKMEGLLDLKVLLELNEFMITIDLSDAIIPISNSEKPVAGNKCYVQTKDIIIHPLTEYLSNDINQCGATSCHTCNIFVNNQSFKSNLTGKEYKTISYDRLSCGSTNVIYGIHCVHCGLVYVGETGRSLRSRMNGHRSAIKKGGQSLLHRHFHQPDHSVDDMRVQILEKVYHSSENPTLLTSLRRTRELFWIKELGTAKPYGFNDQIKGVGTLSSISCKKTNIYSLFNKQPIRKRSHGKRHYNKRTPQPDATTSTLVDLVDMIEKPEGVHNINTKLFSISFPQLRSLQKLALESTNFDYSSAEYRVIAIILDIANYRLFRPVRSDVPAEKPKHFLKIKFLNKAVDAINLPALLRSTSVTDKIPVYFRDKEPPIVSYEYTSTVASKLFNFAPTLSNLNVSEYLSNSQTSQCKKSKFCYEPHGHVITGDLRVIENAKLRELVAKGPKYREPNRVNWKATETMFLESIDLYAKNWS